jgi:hypothetical protein
MTRQSEYLKTLCTKPISAKRLSTHIVKDVQTHFTDFEQCKRKWQIKDANVSNFNKSGFQIRVVCREVVIVPKDCNAVYFADPNNKELVTVVATINYSGQKVPAMIIFKSAYYLRKHFDNNIDSDTLFAQSLTRFSNNKLGLKYLKHFNKFTKDYVKGSYYMLVFNSYRSYLS